jgi:hypothetical protein
MKCSYNYIPGGNYVVGLLENSNPLLDLIISIQKHKGKLFSEISCVLTLTPN